MIIISIVYFHLRDLQPSDCTVDTDWWRLPCCSSVNVATRGHCYCWDRRLRAVNWLICYEFNREVSSLLDLEITALTWINKNLRGKINAQFYWDYSDFPFCRCQHGQLRSHFIWMLFKSPECFKASTLPVKSWHCGMDWFKTLSWLNHFSVHQWDKNICLTGLCCRSTAAENLRELQRGRRFGKCKRALSAAAAKRHQGKIRTMRQPGPAWPVA